VIEALTLALASHRRHVIATTPALERFRALPWWNKLADSGPVVSRISVRTEQSADAAVVPFRAVEEITLEDPSDLRDRETLLEAYVAAVAAVPCWTWGENVIIHSQQPTTELPQPGTLRVDLAVAIEWEGFASCR
jgi:hypothetical protein